MEFRRLIQIKVIHYRITVILQMHPLSPTHHLLSKLANLPGRWLLLVPANRKAPAKPPAQLPLANHREVAAFSIRYFPGGAQCLLSYWPLSRFSLRTDLARTLGKLNPMKQRLLMRRLTPKQFLAKQKSQLRRA